MKIADEIITTLTKVEEIIGPGTQDPYTIYYYKGKLDSGKSFELTIHQNCDFLKEGNTLLGIGTMENNHCVLTAVFNTVSGRIHSADEMSLWGVLDTMYIGAFLLGGLIFILLAVFDSLLPFSMLFLALYVGFLVYLFIDSVKRFLKRRTTNNKLRAYWVTCGRVSND